MLDLTLSEAAQAMNAEVRGPLQKQLDRTFARVCIDSRKISPGDAFFAIIGENHDGHRFVPEAVTKGASLLVVARETPPVDDCLVFKVDDTTRALQRLATQVRKSWNKDLIAITGSMGKTTTKEFIATVLELRYDLLQSSGNFNNHIGVPLTLLDLEPHHQLAVIELGMNHPGEIAQLGRICKPTAAVVTNVAPVHLEFFESIEKIAEAKAEILDSLSRDHHLFYNIDDPRVRCFSEPFPGKQTTFGFSEEADFRVSSFRSTNVERSDFSVEGPGIRLDGSLPQAGKHLVYNAVAAMAVGARFGLSESDLKSAAGQLSLSGGRGRIFQTRGITVWDDSYNSNPRALLSLLDTLKSLEIHNRLVLVLGDMLELGSRGPDYHREIGQHMVGTGAALLITVGELSQEINRGAVANGFPSTAQFHCSSSEETAELLLQKLERGDLLLVKGSRGLGMERIIQILEGGDG